MPMKSGKSKRVVDENFKEFREGKTFSRTAKKFGRKKARQQMIAAVLRKKRESGGRGR